MSGMDQTHQNIPKRSKTVSCLDKCSWFLEQLQDSLVLNSSPSVPAVRLLGLGWHHQGGKLNRTASSCSPHHSHSRLVCHDFSTRSSSSSSSSFTCHFSRIEAVSSSLFRSLLTSGLTGRCTCCAGQFQDPKPVHTELKAAPMVRPGELSKILRCNTIKYNYKLYIQNNINIYHRFMMTHDDSWWLIMTHDAPCQWNESAILHLFSKLKSGMNLPILQLHLSKSWHHGLLFDLLLDYHGNPWKCLRRKGHSLPEGEKSMGASSWASSSCPQRHETSITSRFEDGKKEILTWPQHYINLRWLCLCGARNCFSAAKENLHRPGQTWTSISRAFMWLPTHFQDFTIFQSRECQRDQTFRFLRLCPRSSSARPSVGTAVHRDSKTFRTNCPILLQCDKFLQLQYATRIKHIEHYRTNSCQCTKEYTIFKAHLYHLYPLVI